MKPGETVCMTEDCHSTARTRGICAACYGHYLTMVKKRKTTWTKLVNAGLCLAAAQPQPKSPAARALAKSKLKLSRGKKVAEDDPDPVPIEEVSSGQPQVDSEEGFGPLPHGFPEEHSRAPVDNNNPGKLHTKEHYESIAASDALQAKEHASRQVPPSLDEQEESLEPVRTLVSKGSDEKSPKQAAMSDAAEKLKKAGLDCKIITDPDGTKWAWSEASRCFKLADVPDQSYGDSYDPAAKPAPTAAAPEAPPAAPEPKNSHDLADEEGDEPETPEERAALDRIQGRLLGEQRRQFFADNGFYPVPGKKVVVVQPAKRDYAFDGNPDQEVFGGAGAGPDSDPSGRVPGLYLEDTAPAAKPCMPDGEPLLPGWVVDPATGHAVKEAVAAATQENGVILDQSGRVVGTVPALAGTPAPAPDQPTQVVAFAPNDGTLIENPLHQVGMNPEPETPTFKGVEVKFEPGLGQEEAKPWDDKGGDS